MTRDEELDREFEELARRVQRGEPLNALEDFLFRREAERRAAKNPLVQGRPVVVVAVQGAARG